MGPGSGCLGSAHFRCVLCVLGRHRSGVFASCAGLRVVDDVHFHRGDGHVLVSVEACRDERGVGYFGFCLYPDVRLALRVLIPQSVKSLRLNPCTEMIFVVGVPVRDLNSFLSKWAFCYTLCMSFLEKFKKLLESQPTYALRSVNNVNSDYAHCLSFSKNSYMCFVGWKCEDSYYCYYPNTLKDCCDTYHCIKCELCYECAFCDRCYNCDYSAECVGSRDLKYSYDLKGCSDCFGCVGLRQKSFHIFNEEYSKDDYKRKMEEVRKMTQEEVTRKVEELRKKVPHIASVQLHSENSVGDHIYNSKNCFDCYSMNNVEDAAHCYHIVDKSRDVYDSECMVGELLYECSVGYGLYDCNFCWQCGDLKNAEYCVRVFNSSRMFGCVGVNKEKNMILNAAYSSGAWIKEMRKIRAELIAEGAYYNWIPEILELD